MSKFTQPGRVKNVTGTITAPEHAGLRFILSLCGQSGKFDSDLQALLAKRWVKVREDYKGWFASQMNFKLGSVNTTAVASDIWVVHALVEDKKGEVDMKNLQACLKKVVEMAKYDKASVHVSHLLVEKFPALPEMLMNSLVSEGVNVYFYTEPTK